MGDDFNPRANVRKLRGGAEYLDVKERLRWFRHDHPDGQIDTEHISLTDKIAVFRATVSYSRPDADGRALASGHGSETPGDFPDYIEKAETKAIGRALAALGYGTQFLPDDGERIADSPVERNAPQTRSAPPEQPKSTRSGNVIPKTASMQSKADRIAGYLKDIQGAADSDALRNLGNEMAEAGMDDAGLRAAYRKKWAAFTSTS
jgi:hypothetical protein